MALTAKQEAFCQAIVAGMSQADAYRKAYDAENMKPATVQSKASILMADGKVRARVEELRQPVIQKVRYGLEQAMLEAEEAFQVAKNKENGGAMVAAATLRAKLNGLLVEKKEVRHGSLQDVPDDQLDRLIAQKAREAGVSLH